MTVLVPPTVFDEVKTILDLPVATEEFVKIRRLKRRRIKTTHQETRIVRFQCPIRTEHVTILACKNLTAGNIQPFTNELRVVDVEPQFSYFNIGPLFSTVTSSGLSGSTPEKQAFAASSMSPWFSLIANR